jgi:uncharacterized membrane-anchored protein
MKNPGILVILAAVAILQVAVPVAMIARREATLRLGRAYKFRTAPVDPYDAFRGRYVWLGFEQTQARWTGKAEPTGRSRGYAVLDEGRDGFATVREVTSQQPQSGDYVKVDQVYRGWGTNSAMANFRLPFDRFYMEETKAPAAERAYRENSNRRGQTNYNTYAVVRIKGDDAVIENLYVDGKLISEFARQQPK